MPAAVDLFPLFTHTRVNTAVMAPTFFRQETEKSRWKSAAIFSNLRAVADTFDSTNVSNEQLSYDFFSVSETRKMLKQDRD